MGSYSPSTTVQSQRIAERQAQQSQRSPALRHKAIKSALASHHSSVPAKSGGGGQRGNPNHGDHGYFA